MAQKLKIAVWYNLPSGGAKRSLYAHVEGLKARGHHVEAWRPPYTAEPYLPLDSLVPDHEVSLPFEQATGGRLSKMARFIRQTDRRIAAVEEHSLQCARMIDDGQFDVLFAQPDQTIGCSPIGRLVRIPSAIYLHEPLRPLYEAMPVSKLVYPWREGRPSFKASVLDAIHIRSSRLLATSELRNAYGFSKILVNSLYSRESVLKAYGRSAEVCSLGINTTLFRPLGLERERFALGVGTMGPTKNARLVIEALSSIPEADRPQLVWVSNLVDQPYLQEMRQLAEAREVDFMFLELVTDEELVSLYSRASVMVYAPRLEPFGFAPLEANACGLPVVAVAEGGVRETVRDGFNGLIADHQPEAIASAIHRLLSDSALWSTLSSNAIQGAHSNWTMDAAVDRLEAHLTKLTIR